MADGRFAGKVAVVTGGAHGIGLATARRLSDEGARVVILDLDEQALAAVGDLETVRTDVTAQDDVAAAVGGIVERHGTVDILHNNAGRLRAGSVTEVDVAEWDRTYAVNIRAMFLMCREVIPVMLRSGGGAIVNTASTSGLVGEVGIPAYNSSKGAVIQLTRQLAAEYARQGIRVNCVCPGWIPTGFNDPVLEGLTEDEVQAMVEATVPAGRQGTAEEIAAAVCFLASPDASYVSGHALVVDGGLTSSR
jgi:NAD(P)-dependent dehydrogenase (short-subunit alcohol dehydrogenase family)